MKNTILISGVKSGIGKFILEKLGGIGFTRETEKGELDNLMKRGAETIIHCAFSKNPEEYEKHLKLTLDLTKSKHETFIYLSSVDVYPNNNFIHNEEEEILHSKNEYGEAKLAAEKIVLEHGKNPIILRCTGLLGPYCKKNNLLRLIQNDSPELTLTSDSELNTILYKDVLKFINTVKEKKYSGIYNLASAKNITIEEIAKTLGKTPKYGNFNYNVGNIDNSKAKCLNLGFTKTSLEIIKEFMR